MPAVLLLLFCLSLPAQAAVQGFVACSSDGGYHQYAYQELLDSYALKLSGKQGALYSDYAQKKPVALLSSSGLYVDYGDVLNAYARALLAEELFDLSLYLESKAVSRAAMPASVKLVTLKEGQLVYEHLTLAESSQQAPPEAASVGASPVSVSSPPVLLTATSLAGEATVTFEQALSWAIDCRAHQRFIDVAELYWHYGRLTGLRPELLYAQAAYETGFGRFTGLVPPEYNNWAGIKVAAPQGSVPEDFEQFATPGEGVRAHFNHLAAYMGLCPVGEPHDRYHVVARSSWAGTVVNVEDLSGKWAPSSTYHERIVAMSEEMQAR